MEAVEVQEAPSDHARQGLSGHDPLVAIIQRPRQGQLVVKGNQNDWDTHRPIGYVGSMG